MELSRLFSKKKRKTFDTGLERSKTSMVDKPARAIASESKIDNVIPNNLEDIFVTNDVGADTMFRIIKRIEEHVAWDRYVGTSRLKNVLHDEATTFLAENGATNGGSFTLPTEAYPYAIMIVGVNGVSKTITIDRLAYQFRQQGERIILGAADTFRAAAIEQPEIREERVGVPVIRQQMDSDPTSVVFDTLQSAVVQDADIAIIDTAGHLHNRVSLMNKLPKTKRVVAKVVSDMPHEVLLVFDGPTGQNAFEQARQFAAATDVPALATTRLDGAAKGGVVTSISDQLEMPVKYIGLSEKIEDLQVLHKREFVGSVFDDRP